MIPRKSPTKRPLPKNKTGLQISEFCSVKTSKKLKSWKNPLLRKIWLLQICDVLSLSRTFFLRTHKLLSLIKAHPWRKVTLNGIRKAALYNGYDWRLDWCFHKKTNRISGCLIFLCVWILKWPYNAIVRELGEYYWYHLPSFINTGLKRLKQYIFLYWLPWY